PRELPMRTSFARIPVLTLYPQTIHTGRLLPGLRRRVEAGLGAHHGAQSQRRVYFDMWIAELLLGTAERGFGALYVDLFGLLDRLSEHTHLVGQDLEESA